MNILITGANRGVGLALTQSAVERGYFVIAGARISSPVDRLKQLQQQYPGQVDIVPLDVTDESSVREAANYVEATYRSLDVMINNAGVHYPHEEPVEEIDIGTFIHSFQVNTFGPMMVVKYFIRLMYHDSDCRMIINISTEGLWKGNLRSGYGNRFLGYGASKSALQVITGKLANILAPHRIKVYSLHPGRVKTDMGKNGKIQPRESSEGIMDIVTGTIAIPEDLLYIDYLGNPMK